MPATDLLTIKDALQKSARWLGEKGSPSPRLDAEVLLAHLLGLSRLDLYLSWDRPLVDTEKTQYRALLKRRANHEPVAYITGAREFYGLEMQVGPGVLVPRPETEHLVDLALELCKPLVERGVAPRLADVGTGSGAIAVAVACNVPGATVLATDISEKALHVARANAARHAVADRVTFVHAPLLGDRQESFDMVLSNPPYIAEEERSSLPQDVVGYEPDSALFAGADGLDVIRDLVEVAADTLKPGGWLCFETGMAQGPEALRLLQEQGAFVDCETMRDFQGLDRVCRGRRKDT